MDIIDLLTKVSVRIDCDDYDTHGTGTIIYDNGSYFVMTAAHCLITEEKTPIEANKISITAYAYDNPITIPVIEVVKGSEFSDDKDYALIRIEKPAIDFNYADLVKRCDITLDAESYFCYGFNKYNPYGKKYSLVHNGKNQWHLLNESITNQPVPALNIMGGDSGAAVFFQKADMLFCVGYLKKLNDPTGVGNDIIVYPMSDFDKLLSEETKESNFFKLVERWTTIEQEKNEEDLREVYGRENVEYLQNLERKMGVLYSREKEKKVKQFLRHYTNGLKLKALVENNRHLAEKLAICCNKTFDNADEYRSEYFESGSDARKDLESIESKLEENVANVLDIRNANSVARGYANYNVAERLLNCSLDYKKDNDD